VGGSLRCAKSRQSEKGNLHGLVARARMRWGADTQVVDVWWYGGVEGDSPMRAGKGRETEGFSSTRLLSGCAGSRSTLIRTDEDEGIDGIGDDIDGGIVDGRMEGKERDTPPDNECARVK
jgi:hypothetical protein